MTPILIVEDDVPLSNGIVLTLRDKDRKFSQSYTICAAQDYLLKQSFALIILDINLPDGCGLELCQWIRTFSSVPILFLTANDTELDVVSGLEIGGDDYITKPFSLAVLRARVNVLLRRSTVGPHSPVITIDGFRFDFEHMQFSKNNVSVELSKTEQRLLRLLTSHKGQTLTRDTLLENVWPDGSQYVDENALSVAISRLRAKLEDEPSTPQYIKTVHGIGYAWRVIG